MQVNVLRKTYCNFFVSVYCVKLDEQRDATSEVYNAD